MDELIFLPSHLWLRGSAFVANTSAFELLAGAEFDYGVFSSFVVEALDLLNHFYLYLTPGFNVEGINGSHPKRVKAAFCERVVVAI
jgi:hypothetical protein